MPSLFVIEGNDQGARYELDRDSVGLGREAANDIQIHDTEVSRRHAVIQRAGHVFELADLGSSNGTFVNNQRVQRHTLASGDEVQMGSTRMLFTGAAEETGGDLAQTIDIIRQQADDHSRIIHSVSHEEGSRILSGGESGETPWLDRARSNLEIMYRTALAVSHTLDIDQLLHRIMQLIFEWVEADRGCILLVSSDTKKLEPRVRRSRNPAQAADRIRISKTILDYVMEHNQGVLTSDARQDERWDSAASIVQMGVREAMCVPMQGRHSMVGVIYIDTSTTPQQMIKQGATARFSEEHLRLMVAIAHQAALAVEDTRYYSAMVQSERLAAVGQAIAMLSHHVKNILQGIRGGSFLIKEGLSQHDEEMTRKGWQFVEKNQERISNLVLDMLTFSKEREPEMAPAEVNQVIGDVVELMESRAAEHNVKLQFTPAPGVPTLTFDPDGIHRAVLNVLTNAIDACGGEEQPGEVRVATRYDQQARRVSVEIHDNGPGIAADDIENVFSLFVSRKGSGGTGLGLPVSQKILREHGGRISVASPPGEGTRFTIEWPAVTVDAEAVKGTGHGNHSA